MWNDTKKKQENFISSASSFREENYNSYIMWSSILISTSYSEEDLYCQSLKKGHPHKKNTTLPCAYCENVLCSTLFFHVTFLCSSQWKNRPVCEFLTKVCDEEENSILLWWKTKMIMVSPVILWNMIDESSCSGR